MSFITKGAERPVFMRQSLQYLPKTSSAASQPLLEKGVTARECFSFYSRVPIGCMPFACIVCRSRGQGADHSSPSALCRANDDVAERSRR